MRAIKSLLISGVVGVSSLLAGCGTTPNADVATQVQETAVQICKFEPTVATVTQIIAALAGVGDQAALITEAANKICDAVAPIPQQARLRLPLKIDAPVGVVVVNGVSVIVVGHYQNPTPQQLRLHRKAVRH